MKAINIVMLCILMSLQVMGQQYLYVKKKGKIPAERLALFDNVKVRLSDTTSWVKGHLEMINTESLKIRGQVFQLKEIQAIRVNNSLVKLTGTAMWASGVLFTSIALVNGLVNGDSPPVYPRQLIVGAGLVGGGVLVAWLSRKTYSREKGYTFEVIDLDNIN